MSGRPDKPMEVAPTWKNACTAPPKAPPIQAEMNGLPSGKVNAVNQGSPMPMKPTGRQKLWFVLIFDF